MTLIDAATEGNLDNVKASLQAGETINQMDREGWTAVAHALSKGEGEVALYLIQQGCDLSTRTGTSRWTLAHWAAKHGMVDVLQAMAKRKFNVRTPDNNGDTPLHVAATEGETQACVTLLQLGEKADVRTKDGFTPLHNAARHGHRGVVEALLNKKADPNAENQENWTPLFYALLHGHRNCFELLLEKGGKMEKVKKLGQMRDSLLFSAVSNGVDEAIPHLVKFGANLNARNQDGVTPLMRSLKRSVTSWREDGVPKALLDAGADPNVGIERAVPLAMALRICRWEAAEYLIEKGANVNLKTPSGRSPLQIGIEENRTNVAKSCITHGANVNEEGLMEPLLHAALKRGMVEVVELLVNNVANLAQKDKAGQTPLLVALMFKQVASAQLIFDKGGDCLTKANDGDAPLHVALATGQEGLALQILERGASAKDPGAHGRIPLELAIENNLPKVTINIIERGGYDPAQDSAIYQPFIRAAARGLREVVKLLSARGANVQQQDPAGATALHWAALKGHSVLVALLLELHADPNHQDSEQHTPLHWSVVGGSAEIVKFLLASGAKGTIADRDGDTPLHLAVASGQSPVVEAFREVGLVLTPLPVALVQLAIRAKTLLLQQLTGVYSA